MIESGAGLQLGMSFTAATLLIVPNLFSLGLACWLARYPRKTSAGIALGTLSGFILINLASGLVALLGYLLPIGQMDFWLAHLLGPFWG